jgi:uncharacterized protein YndB with AHSA1/START domain
MSKMIQKAAVIAAPASEVWKLWTTAEGLASFFCHHAVVELEKGGKYEIYFHPTDEMRSTKGAKCLSFAPDKMLSFEWRGGPFSQSMNANPLPTWVVLQFHSEGDQARVELVHVGFRDEGDFEKGFEYFTDAWGEVLEDCRKKAEEKFQIQNSKFQ